MASDPSQMTSRRWSSDPDDYPPVRSSLRRAHDPLCLVLIMKRAKAKKPPIARLGRPSLTAIRIIERRFARRYATNAR